MDCCDMAAGHSGEGFAGGVHRSLLQRVSGMQRAPCRCPARGERRSGIVSLVELRQLRDRVGELSAVLKGREVELGELQKSLSVAIDSRNEQVAVQAVTQTRDRMESIKKTISDVDEAGWVCAAVALDSDRDE